MSDTAQLLQRVEDLQARLQRFEDIEAIRACVLRYMALCDRLDADTPLDELGDCFTADAVWQGRGSRYHTSFGAHVGRAAVVAMLAHYCGSADTAPHFAFNAHFLCNEQITATGAGTAHAEWQMLQTSTFSAGGAHLNAAHLRLDLRHEPDGRWRITRFETENLLSRPVTTWHADTPLPVPTTAAHG